MARYALGMLELEQALLPWGNCKVLQPLNGGYRNAVYLVEIGDTHFVAKTSRRSEEALSWLEPVHQAAREAGCVVPELVRSPVGTFKNNGFTLEPFIAGKPTSVAELPELMEPIQTFHKLTQRVPQRPGFASSVELLQADNGGDVDLSQMPPELVQKCRTAWRMFAQMPQSVVHGDLGIGNVLRTSQGALALLDWDEARVDLPIFDTLTLLRPTISKSQELLLDCWEIAVCWQIEPEHARKLAVGLL